MSFAQRPLVRLVAVLSLAASAWAVTAPAQAASDDERSYLSKPEIQTQIVGHGILSKNVASGKLSHWEFHPDGRVQSVATAWAVPRAPGPCATTARCA